MDSCSSDIEGSSEDDGLGERHGSPKGRKRARVNTQGDSRPVANGRSKGKAKARPTMQPLTRHPDGFVPGSIIRVKLHNFVTYDDVEFYPGPHLNMIIGPNGTGKSSIACAIALGLNWPPSILGRANELNLFVKNTKDEGFIEIELKGNIGKPNVVIKRTLSAKSKASTFFVNGRSSTGREITNTMNELNIQVGNLCSFLPQDRVSEFAQMTPQQLLRETQRAAGDEHLTAWHDTLISAGKEKKETIEIRIRFLFLQHLDADRKQLETLRERNDNLEREVQRFRERKEIEKRIAVLEVLVPFMEYYETRERYREAKTRQRELHAKVAALQRKTQPIEEFKRRLGRERQRMSEQQEQKKRSLRKQAADLRKKTEDNDSLTATAEEAHVQLENLRRNEKTRVKRIHDLEKSTADLRAELIKPVELGDLDAIAEETRALNMVSASLSQKRIDLSDRQAQNMDISSKWKADIAEGTRNLQQLDNVSHQKLEALKRSDPDCYATVIWLRQNQRLFREEILEPPIVTLTVPDGAYLAAVEACFASHQLRTFVAQNDDDYRLLNRLVVDTTEALGRQARIPTSLNKVSNGQAPLPMTDEQARSQYIHSLHIPILFFQLRELGFDGWALDFVSCPQGLHTFLKQSVHLHRTAIGIRSPQRIDSGRAMNIIARGGGASYVIGRTMNTVMKSQYGRRLAQNVTREIKPPRNLIGPTFNPQYKIDCQRKISDAQEQLKTIDVEAEQLANEDHALKEQEREHRKAHVRVYGVNRRRIPYTLVTSEEMKLRDFKTQLPPDAERERLKTFLLQISHKRVALAEKFLGITRTFRTEQVEHTRLSLQALQLASDLTALDTLIQERHASYQETLDLYQAASQVFNDLKAECITKKQSGEAKLNAADDDVKALIVELQLEQYSRNHTSQEINIELAEQQQKLELVMEANPGVIEQYERRKAEIETLSKKVEERERRTEKLDRTIQSVHDRWLPALQELVSSIGDKFSTAFDRIGCSGELELTESEDYDKWAITIWVKFRDDAQLQKLTPHRQSGGERSLTTIMYLMSMTEQARSPFSLVDEINQGMDQRAERAIHDQLVQTTCETECGQYFLITPKLLPDLGYHKRMKILCVNNGEWLPADDDLGGSMRDMLSAYRLHPSRNASGSSSVDP
ncbi:hypothetical protein K488DRAFT_40522 [Vararia minispora EC-137]|uniref:Uncharacterized protein n=1 Tax=Vararia minispora EC-137 TaxID=1314806 RepID=A0ACB8QYV4_9AGAM|nr:hypothetical protein K488DRAFT_40522 [Vararia minispora EC-137]